MKLFKEKYFTAALLSLFLLLFIIHFSPFFSFFRAMDIDFFTRLKPLKSPNNIVIVQVDDSSSQYLNKKWPWPRAFFAKAISNLSLHSPKAVGLDFIFSGKGKAEDDAKMEDALKQLKAPVILAMNFFSNEGPLDMGTANLDNMNIMSVQMGMELPAFKGKPGFINISKDADEVIRRARLVYNYQNKVYDSFAMALYRKSFQQKTKPETNKELNIYYSPENSFQKISFFQLYNNQVPKDFFKDKIVLIGPEMSGVADHHKTPLSSSKLMSGVEIHAHILKSLVSNKQIYPQPTWLLFLISLFFGIILLVLFFRLSSFLNFSLSVVASLLLYFAISYLLFSSFQMTLSNGSYLLFSLSFTLCLLFIKKAKEKSEQEDEIKKLKEELKDEEVVFEDVKPLFFEENNISSREQEIIALILEGVTNKTISEKLFISLSTVKKHVYNIYQKLGINKRPELLQVIQKYSKE